MQRLPRTRLTRPMRPIPALFAALALTSCTSTAEPELPAVLVFDQPSLELGTARSASVEVRNTGGSAAGPVELKAGPVRDEAGSAMVGTVIQVVPGEVPTLNPGDAVTVELHVLINGTVNPGRYDASLTADAGPGLQALSGIRFEVLAAPGAEGVTVLSADTTVRRGDVVPLRVEVRDADGAVLEGATVSWSATPGNAGLVSGAGQFVPYRTGDVTLVATAGSDADTLFVQVSERGLSGAFSVVGSGVEQVRYTSDLWLHGDFAYSGTWSARPGAGAPIPGNQLSAWRISDPSNPFKVSTIEVDARTVNDVKIRADGRLGVMTHEGSNDGLNGVSFLDLADPSRPSVVGRYTETLETGVHNAWLDGDYAYLVVDGSGGGLRVLDVSEPSRPATVASFYAGTSFLHDVYVRDGLAFLSHWNAGLVILDVGNGIVGGSPTVPVEVSRIATLGGQTHNAWYWPKAGYVFVGEEDFSQSAPGVMHVVDVRNVREPREVATFAVEGQTPHNFWLDESRGVLYLAWYAQGLRALDVTGTLLGELDRQGREIASSRYNGGSVGCNRPSTFTCTWAPQLHRGLVWVSDMNRGLVALDPPS